MENSKEQLNDHDMVVDFLRRISTATGALAQIDDEDQCMTDDSELNVADLVDKIARNLLSACHPHILASGISNLPSLETCADEKLTMEQSNEEENWKAYNYRRSDYLRRLLRVMASISMDVLANICSIVVSSQKTQPSVNQSSFLLISHWLPVAPHLASMATDLLKTLVDPLKITESNTQDTQFLVAETCHHLCSFYMQRGEISTIRHLWDWSFVFGMLEPGDTEMSTSETLEMHLSPCFPTAIRWFSARILTYLLDWKPSVVASVLAQLELEDKLVPWTIHPWALDQEELDMQNSHFQGRTRLWESDEFSLPSSEQIQKVLSTSACLAKIGPGLTFYRRDTIIGMGDAENLIHQGVDAGEDSGTNNHLVPTPTTCRNLSLLGAALCEQPHPAPILICGPHGSGKSSLVRELLRLCRPKDSLLEFHIDEETDSKTLIGSYTITDIPGEFAWRPGALTHATREGRWVLLEDVDSVPSEIQATLVKLLEDRMLPLGNGEYEPCHPNFRIFGTCTTSSSQQQQQRHSLRVGANRGGGKRILNPSLWRKVHVRPLPYSELKQVAMSLYNDIPESIFDSALSLLQTLDRSGRTETTQLDQQSDDDEGEGDDFCATLENRTTAIWTGGRVPSVRDFFKLFSRISNDICFEKNVAYTTEAQRTLCLAESVDIFVGSCPERDSKRDFVSTVAAPIWGISRDLALSYVETRRPPTLSGADFVEIGRAKIHIGLHSDHTRMPSDTFAATNHALRLMESVGVCIRENEPILLVGETGCGKTTLIQQLAANCERELIVQNLSLQTDSTDLLGGYRPLELRNVARKVYQDFVDIFVATFSRKQNAKFLQYASSMHEKSNWKKMSQCLQRAAKLGLAKMKEQTAENSTSASSQSVATLSSWTDFSKTSERFERQRLSCDAGLAFVFSEGALVDAIQSGKW